MPSELKRIERSVNVLVGKPLALALFALLVLARHGFKALVRFSSWLRSRYAASAEKA